MNLLAKEMVVDIDHISLSCIGRDTTINILRFIYDRGRATLTDIYKGLEMTKGHTSRRLVDMMESGLVYKEDRKKWICYTLSITGVAIVEQTPLRIRLDKVKEPVIDLDEITESV